MQHPYVLVNRGFYGAIVSMCRKKWVDILELDGSVVHVYGLRDVQFLLLLLRLVTRYDPH